ncbi:methyltransferase domain-containing protein [Nocardia terpenica]|uniref:Methyltransferase domain-containing protein n=2 Tax=Nocardia terpenica TaxID=455432 RepID=A0A6G9YZ56_9NOCA|nr:methyltransferase domain-containing protein [Nocardia terpenica]
MVTLPPGHPGPPEHQPHRARDMAESFGAEAARYDRARPRYPDAMVHRLVAASPGPDVLDVGCGTGIAARQFRAAGCRVLGVEPDARMADFARAQGLEVEVARFEEWDRAGRTFDAVIAGQAWHWVDPLAGARSSARALRPGGRFAVFWNAMQLPPEVEDAFAEVYQRVLPDMPILRGMTAGAEAYSAICTRAEEGLHSSDSFTDLDRWQFPWPRTYTRDEWVDGLPTAGISTRLPTTTMNELITDIGEAIDNIGGTFTMHYTTVVLTAQRTDTT